MFQRSECTLIQWNILSVNWLLSRNWSCIVIPWWNKKELLSLWETLVWCKPLHSVWHVYTANEKLLSVWVLSFDIRQNKLAWYSLLTHFWTLMNRWSQPKQQSLNERQRNEQLNSSAKQTIAGTRNTTEQIGVSKAKTDEYTHTTPLPLEQQNRAEQQRNQQTEKVNKSHTKRKPNRQTAETTEIDLPKDFFLKNKTGIYFGVEKDSNLLLFTGGILNIANYSPRLRLSEYSPVINWAWDE